MLQHLLEERFHLTLHHEPHRFQGYEQSVSKSRSKLQESAKHNSETAESRLDRPGLVMSFRFGDTGIIAQIAARDRPLSALIDLLIRTLKQPVLDGTDLTGDYDFTLEFSGNPHSAPGDAETDLAFALQEQLGLKLESRKLTLDMLVVDHADQTPTEKLTRAFS